MVWSMAGSAAATVALAAVRGLGPVMAVAALTGLAAESYRPAVSAILAAGVPGRQRVQAFGVYQVGASAGATAGPAIGGLVADHSFLVLFACDAATSLLWAVLALRTLPGIPAVPGPASPQPPGRRQHLLRDRRLLRLLAVTVLVNLILFQAQTTLPLWVHRQGLPTSSYGLLLAVNSGLVVALQLPAARLTGRWRPQPVIAVASVVAGAGFALYGVSPAVLWGACAVAGVCAAAVITPGHRLAGRPAFTAPPGRIRRPGAPPAIRRPAFLRPRPGRNPRRGPARRTPRPGSCSAARAGSPAR